MLQGRKVDTLNDILNKSEFRDFKLDDTKETLIIAKLYEEINQTRNELNELVFDLYQLSTEERKLISKSKL